MKWQSAKACGIKKTTKKTTAVVQSIRQFRNLFTVFTDASENLRDTRTCTKSRKGGSTTNTLL